MHVIMAACGNDGTKCHTYMQYLGQHIVCCVSKFQHYDYFVICKKHHRNITTRTIERGNAWHTGNSSTQEK